MEENYNFTHDEQFLLWDGEEAFDGLSKDSEIDR